MDLLKELCEDLVRHGILCALHTQGCATSKVFPRPDDPKPTCSCGLLRIRATVRAVLQLPEQPPGENP